MARLLNAVPRDGDTREQRMSNQSRMGRIINIGERYVRNIAQSKRFSNDYKRSGVESARNRSYSQNTYMGYNNG